MLFYFVISSFMRIFADNLGHCAPFGFKLVKIFKNEKETI